MKDCFACQRIELIKQGANLEFVAELDETYVVLSNEQFYRGYCILLLKSHIEHMLDLEAARQQKVLAEVMKVAGAVKKAFSPARINYECLGNAMPHIHWHVIPRYADDTEKTDPIWLRPIEERRVALSDQDLFFLKKKIKESFAG